MKPNDTTALRKRTQISKANRTMFLWIAGASALLSFAVVASVFLSQKLVFNEKVLFAKNKTVSTLNANNKAVADLQTNVRVLDTDPNLAKVKANPNDQAIQVILDALPSDANSLALGASLQNVLLANIPGLTIESLQVEPVAGIETIASADDVDATDTNTDTSTDNQINFTFVVNGNQDVLKQALQKLERSIRTIDITNLRVENQNGIQVMTVQGHAYYEPAKDVSLKDEVIKP